MYNWLKIFPKTYHAQVISEKSKCGTCATCECTQFQCISPNSGYGPDAYINFLSDASTILHFLKRFSIEIILYTCLVFKVGCAFSKLHWLYIAFCMEQCRSSCYSIHNSILYHYSSTDPQWSTYISGLSLVVYTSVAWSPHILFPWQQSFAISPRGRHQFLG